MRHRNSQSSDKAILPRDDKGWNQREESPSKSAETPVQVSAHVSKWQNKLFFMQSRQKVVFPSHFCQEWILGFPCKSSWQHWRLESGECNHVLFNKVTACFWRSWHTAIRFDDGSKGGTDQCVRSFSCKPITLPFCSMNDLGFLYFNFTFFFFPV